MSLRLRKFGILVVTVLTRVVVLVQVVLLFLE